MRLTVRPIPPYDFDLSLSIYSEGDGQIRRFEKERYWQVVRLGDKLAFLSIESSGTIDNPKLIIELESVDEISDSDVKTAKEIVDSCLNLGLDLKPFYEHVKTDETMHRLTQELRGLKSPNTASIFEALISSIIEQQISLRVAHALETNVVKSFGDVLHIGRQVYYAFPTPRRLSAASAEQLLSCGLSRRKTEYIREISASVASKELDLEKFKSYQDTSEIVDELDKVRGIGVWTAELTLLRGMNRLDAIPADDLGLRRCISHYYSHDAEITSEKARQIAERWGRWKGLAGYYLIVARRLRLEV